MRYLIGRYHEIALKGRNQWRFVNQVKQNLRDIFGDYQLAPIRSHGPRLMVPLPDDLSDETAAERAALIFGLQNFSLSYSVPPDIESITREAIRRATGNRAKTFRVRTKREDKRFAMTSPEIDSHVGGEVQEALGFKVDLKDAELTISIEIMHDAAYVSAGKTTGAGGLPVGISGHGVALLSGGIDSPVAAYRMMKRGLSLDFVHFHAHPLVSPASKEKAAELAAHLTRYQARSTLMLVAFGDLQREIVANTLRPLRVVLYRRFMLRIASALAERSRATVLVTGESLGQVASQTLENMVVIEKAAAYPIMRPLVGMDKNEIIDQARQLGTFDTSIIPDQDCCTLFVPAHPETRARIEEVEAAESRFDIPRMVADAMRSTQMVRFSFPPREKPAATARTPQSRY
jgi:thiamine biosynthesis protein ThiI